MDLLGRLLFLSATICIDLESVFPCFAYPDRTVDKSTVCHHLNKHFQSNPLDTIATAIADSILFLNTSTQNLTKTYSALARRVLVKFLNLTNICVYLYFDICESSIFNDVKRKDRGDIETRREDYV